MGDVAAHAGRDIRIIFLQQPATVHRRPVLRDLIDPQGGVELSHELRVGVTAAAYFDDLRQFWLPYVALRGILGDLLGLRSCGCPITAVASDAAETPLGVDVVLEQLRGP
jgi:hypothetical protein